MIIPPFILAKLGSQGLLEVPEALAEGFSEGYKIGQGDTVDFFKRLLIRERAICAVFPLDNEVDDEFIRGYSLALKNLEEKYKIKYA